MPLYEYKCRKCGKITIQLRNDVKPVCDMCHDIMGRKFSFYVKQPFAPHYNTAIGKYVSTRSEFNAELSRLSDKQSERTGIEHNYVPVDLADTAAFGATDEGAEKFQRSRYGQPFTESFD